MTTLFSIFAPMLVSLSLKTSLGIMLLTTFIPFTMVCLGSLSMGVSNKLSVLFSSQSPTVSILLGLFVSLSYLNLLSMVLYSYPVTTTLGFNLSAALSCWLCGIYLQSNKSCLFSSILPSNSPWYLIPFLCLVEMVSILVRPVTLCFRLLANMTAGHVLLALICKMNYFWPIGSIFSVLELAVATVQAFVFSMLISVYVEEAMTH